MPYTLGQAANVMAIGEREWGTAAAIQFTAFTSCIGVLAKSGQNQVVGIHLSLFDAQGNKFGVGDVARVMDVLAAQNYDNTTCLVIGQIAFWEASAGPAYAALVAALNNPGLYPLADGTYGAEIDNGAVTLTF